MASSTGLPVISLATKPPPIENYSISSSDRTEESIHRGLKKAHAAVAADRLNARSLRIRPPVTTLTAPKTVLSSATQHDTNYKLSAESSIAAQKEVVLERWRSSMLQYETDLRELASCSPSEPPTESRIIKVLHLYDSVCRRVDDTLSPYLAELLRLFRIEFCRAIFTTNCVGTESTQDFVIGNDQIDAINEEGDVCTFFDQLSSLRRENAFLSRELSASGTQSHITELRCEVERLKGNIKLCENEIDRLSRQNTHVTKQNLYLCDKMDSEQKAYTSQISAMEKELRANGVENKDLQLQLFCLRKEAAGGKGKLVSDYYKHLKNAKMSFFTTLFSESDERISILVLLSQLEFRLNEALDSYDDAYILHHADRFIQSELRRKMEEGVALILEEMHFCEQQYRRLTRRPSESQQPDQASTNPKRLAGLSSPPPGPGGVPDETDSYVTMLFNFKIYDNMLHRETIRRRAHASGGKAASDDKRAADSLAGGASCDESIRGQSHASAARSAFSAPVPLDTTFLTAYRGSLTRLDQKEANMHGGEGSSLYNTSFQYEKHIDEFDAIKKDEFVFATRNEWIERMLGTMGLSGGPEKRTLSGVRWTPQGSEGSPSPDTLLPRLLRRPLADLCAQKFIAGVDIFFGSDPVQQELLCSMSHIDPSLPIQLPEQANFIKLKYKSSIAANGKVSKARTGEDEGELPQEVSVDEEHAEAGAAEGPMGVLEPVQSYTRVNAAGLHSPHRSKAKPPYVGKRNASVFHFSKQASKHIKEWGPKTQFEDEQESNDAKDEELFRICKSFSVFHELQEESSMGKDAPGRLTTRVTGSSNANVLISYQRLDPLSPNRAPEWILYQSLFGGFRCLIPRVLDHSIIDHILLCACERHFMRMEYRYVTCLNESNTRTTGGQMLFMLAERLFRETYELSDFQKSIVDELEARYWYPEVVAKTFYELLCFLDAAAARDALYSLYLEVIRGFKSPTYIHFVSYMLFNMSYSWPSSDPDQVVSKDEALAMLRYMYRNVDIVVHVDVHEVLSDYERMSRAAPLTLNHMHSYIASIILHQEETMLLYLQGLFRSRCNAEDLQKLTYENYSNVIVRHWNEKSPQSGVVRFLSTSLGFNRSAFLSSDDLALVAASYWASDLLL